MSNERRTLRLLFRTALFVLSVGAICVSGFAIIHRAAAQRAAVGGQQLAVHLAKPGLDQTGKDRMGNATLRDRSETLSNQGGDQSQPFYQDPTAGALRTLNAQAMLPQNPPLATQGNDAAQRSQTGSVSEGMPFGLPPNTFSTTHNPTRPTDHWEEEEIGVLRPVTTTKMVRQPDGTMQPVTTVEYQRTMVTRRVPRGSNSVPFAQTVTSQVYAPSSPASPDPTDQRIAELLSQYRSNDLLFGEDATRVDSELAQELRTLVMQQFDQRHQLQSERLKKLVADLDQTQEILDQRYEHKDEIVRRRVAQLLGQRDPLNWEYEPSTPVYPVDPNYGYPTPSTAPAANLNLDAYPSPPNAGGLQNYPSNENLRARDALARKSLPSNRPQLNPNSFGAPIDRLAPNALPAETRDPRFASPAQSQQPLSAPPSNILEPSDFTPNEFTQTLAPLPTKLENRQPTDLIASGFRLRSLQQSLPALEDQSRRGLVSKTEVQGKKNEMLEAKTVWEFMKKGLASQIRAAELKFSGLKEDVSEYEKLYKAGGVNDSELRKLKQQLELQAFELERLAEQLAWSEKFEREELANTAADIAVEPADDSADRSPDSASNVSDTDSTSETDEGESAKTEADNR